MYINTFHVWNVCTHLHLSTNLEHLCPVFWTLSTGRSSAVNTREPSHSYRANVYVIHKEEIRVESEPLCQSRRAFRRYIDTYAFTLYIYIVCTSKTISIGICLERISFPYCSDNATVYMCQSFRGIAYYNANFKTR